MIGFGSPRAGAALDFDPTMMQSEMSMSGYLQDF